VPAHHSQCCETVRNECDCTVVLLRIGISRLLLPYEIHGGDTTNLTSHLTVVQISRRRPHGEVVEHHGKERHAANDGLGSSRSAEHLSLERELNDEIAFY